MELKLEILEALADQGAVVLAEVLANLMFLEPMDSEAVEADVIGGGSQNGGGDGGDGVVIIKIPTSQYTGTTTGSPTVTESGDNTIMTFNGAGTYTT